MHQRAGMTPDIDFDSELTDLDADAWVARVEEVARDLGSYDRLGPNHAAALLEAGSTLLVAFEPAALARKANPDAEPRGWNFVRDSGWSVLSMLSFGETWFRDRAVYDHFDHLVDEGFFDGFEQVLFYGAGAAGYAAAAFSVAAPGARVLAIGPQATLDPRVAGWDRRSLAARRLCFTDRYGYAPEMIEAAAQAVILHDPAVPLDAMHAALFRGDNVTVLRAPRLSARTEKDLDQMGILDDLIEATAEGALTPAVFSRLWRRRKRHLPYLRATLRHLELAGRYGLAARLCRDVARRTGRPMFQRKLDLYVARGLIPAPRRPDLRPVDSPVAKPAE